MKAAVLIIGSLWWDTKQHRKRWRKDRLLIDQATRVAAPVRYGRKSSTRGNTYTMVLAPEGKMGWALLVPLRNPVTGIGDIIDEAEALWGAEAPESGETEISANWGSVGASFTSRGKSTLADAWAKHFRGHGRLIEPINEQGILEIPWPGLETGNPAEFNVILATANRADTPMPSAAGVAAAWTNQGAGFEDYFFKNVRHGIRTADDTEIWRRIENNKPQWLGNSQYSQAVKILRSDQQTQQ